ncbi:MAG: Hint domain-containing protein [Acidimicrobiales bacterium]
MLYLADQFARMTNASGEQRPVVIVDPKALALDTPIPTPSGWVQMGDLRVGDKVFGSDGTPCNVTQLSRVFKKPDLYAVTFDDGQVIRADAGHQWLVTELPTLHNNAGIAKRRERAIADAEVIGRLLDEAGDDNDVPVDEIFSLITDGGCRTWGSPRSLARALQRESCLPPSERWNLQLALKTLHVILEKAIWSYRPSKRMMTTSEMLVQGVNTGHQSRFAVKTAQPFEMPDAALPVDPYILGVWLGDGIKKGKDIACGAEDVDMMIRLLSECWPNISVHNINGPGCPMISCDRDFTRCLYGHKEYADRKRGDGTSKHCKECWRVQAAVWKGKAEDTRERINPSLHHLLNDIGVIGNKHIPAIYQRASVPQRLALLQGLMDTDGTVKRSGSCRLVLTNKRLITDALELIRGLGYKATLWEGPATITEDDPENPGEKRRRVTGTAYYINFKTNNPVFRMPRKLALLPKSVPVQSKWHYVRSIEPVESAPARCIVVDSADHTYLAGQFIPTHNSGSNHSAAVLASGGQVQSLDELTKSDGVFDPIRFAMRKEVGVEMASTMLLSINPFGGEKLNYETPLIHALSYGVSRGADCIGVALQYALDAGVAPKEMVERVFNLASASPMFHACVGTTQGGISLRTAGGITLIKVGESHLDLPEPGSTDEATQPQRIALALVRMIVFGSAMALTNRQGVLMLDEAWVMLSAGRSEIERLGRLARSQQVLPMLWTQRITDATNAGLTGYISRGLILPIQDPDEANAACSLYKLEATPERMSRITAKATISGNTDQAAGAPNWHSMRALRDHETGKVVRGAIGIYVDLAGRAVPTEIKIPPAFFDRASTNPEDIRRRQAAEAAARGDSTQGLDDNISTAFNLPA